jgi:hypothetical protein
LCGSRSGRAIGTKTRSPPVFFLNGLGGLTLLAALLLPALGFLCHCDLSLPSRGFFLRGAPTAPQLRCQPARPACARSALASRRIARTCPRSRSTTQST